MRTAVNAGHPYAKVSQPKAFKCAWGCSQLALPVCRREPEDAASGGEEQVTMITESMSVTSADEEKLLLLNRNTELRRINKEVKGHGHQPGALWGRGWRSQADCPAAWRPAADEAE